jgi:SAM-dependent methyltransferase
MHEEQVDFCKSVKIKFPQYFQGKRVLDVGSLDVNGNNRYLFTNCEYIGVDVGAGKNVDVVTPGHLYDAPDESFDVIISTECFEHDMYYSQTWSNIVRLLKPNGMFLFTCASPGREEHGTLRTRPQDSPLTSSITEWSNYYKNLSEEDLKNSLDLDEIFENYFIDEHHEIKVAPTRYINDLYFWGIKR